MCLLLGAGGWAESGGAPRWIASGLRRKFCGPLLSSTSDIDTPPRWTEDGEGLQMNLAIIVLEEPPPSQIEIVREQEQ